MQHDANNDINNDNIDLLIVDETVEEEFDINGFLKDFEEKTNSYNESLYVSNIMNYTDNFTVKELLLICEYYGISKELKANKCKKDMIINILLEFESNPLNSEIVFKRQNMWFYMNELKNDKFMKKFILW
jgi:hypothetical protein